MHRHAKTSLCPDSRAGTRSPYHRILRRENPTKYRATGQELRRAYAAAYSMMGDYCGGGEAKIRQELLAIVDAEFQKLGVP